MWYVGFYQWLVHFLVLCCCWVLFRLDFNFWMGRFSYSFLLRLCIWIHRDLHWKQIVHAHRFYLVHSKSWWFIDLFWLWFFAYLWCILLFLFIITFFLIFDFCFLNSFAFFHFFQKLLESYLIIFLFSLSLLFLLCFLLLLFLFYLIF